MFRMCSIVGFAAAILIAIVFRFTKTKGACFSAAGKDNWFVGIIKALVVVFGMLSAAALIVTGFAGRLISDELINGYTLMLHASAAPVFMSCVAAASVLWADSAKLSITGQASEVCVRKRIGFWAILALSVPVFLSIIFSMLPIFGTHMQEVLFEIHRWCALGLAMLIIFEIACTSKPCESKHGQ